MKISACVIVKNEEKNIETWCRSISAIADEVIIVDTGSSDNTVELSKKMGVKLYSFSWKDDFALAKNFAISKANGDWIIFLDADEYWDSGCASKIRNHIRRFNRERQINAISCKLINIDVDNNNKVIDSIIQTRIFRNSKTIRYQGKIHEQLINISGSLNTIFIDDICIYHTGYSASIKKRKAERNIKLLQAEWDSSDISKRKDIAPLLMDAYFSMENYDVAIELARYSIKHNLERMGSDGSIYETLFSALQRKGASVKEQLAVLDEAISRYPEESCFSFEKGYVCWQMGALRSAKECMEHGLEIYSRFKKKTSAGMVKVDNSMRLIFHIYAVLGWIAIAENKRDIAAEYFVDGIKLYKHDFNLLRGLHEALKNAASIDKIEIINSFYDRVNDADFIFNALFTTGDKDILAYYGKNAKGVSEIRNYMGAGRYDSAVVLTASRLRQLSNLAVANGLTNSERTSSVARVLLSPSYQNALDGKRNISAVNRIVDLK